MKEQFCLLFPPLSSFSFHHLQFSKHQCQFCPFSIHFQPQCFKRWHIFFPRNSVKSSLQTGVWTQLADITLTTAQKRILRPEPVGRFVLLPCQNSSDQSLWFEGDGIGDCWYFPVSLQEKRERNESISTRHKLIRLVYSKHVFSMWWGMRINRSSSWEVPTYES